VLQLAGEYATRYASLRGSAMADLFLEDGVLDQAWGLSQGRAAIADAYDERFRSFDSGTAVYLTNHLVRWTEPGGAELQSRGLAFLVLANRSAMSPTLLRASYHFRLALVEQRWRIAKLSVSRDGIGNLVLQEADFTPPGRG
jgi:hypothetical protein